ncbi:DUF1127 domain-containing protein [Sulfitobacter sp. F26204]|uniref:DUF1127 domain-containing protein n=1 Tax=Sulfitobacter sp. F26204 TaxID=2996014 RepID=UPI00225DD905|nr:DUF1127 domain-containing protein [Sulfitobacter sp. F26204]MCX7559086.1 DUF1127 domain-containing protein [Sulfitobacter sp. F26204]
MRLSPSSVVVQTAICQPARPSLIQRINIASAVARSRRQLAALDPHQLDDIGISETTAKTEAKRPFWHTPAQWIK